MLKAEIRRADRAPASLKSRAFSLKSRSSTLKFCLRLAEKPHYLAEKPHLGVNSRTTR